MKVMGPNDFDVGPCICKRGEDMSPIVRCRLCFAPYHEGKKCNFKNPDFAIYREVMDRRQCPTCFSYSISKVKPPKDGDPRLNCGVCHQFACGHCLQSWEIIKNHGASMHRRGCTRHKKMPKMQLGGCRDGCKKCKLPVLPLENAHLPAKEMEDVFRV
jgi:hypothetical protein